MAFLQLPSEVLMVIFTAFVESAGIKHATESRLVCRAFDHYTQDAIYRLPTFDQVEDQPAAHLRRDPRMDKTMVARLVSCKVETWNAKRTNAPLLANAILETASSLQRLTTCSEGDITAALIRSTAQAIPLIDVVRGLSCRVEKWRQQDTMLENQLVGAIYTGQGKAVDSLLRQGAQCFRFTSFFGDALSAAARFGDASILEKLLVHKYHHLSEQEVKLLEVRRMLALDSAACSANLEKVRLLLADIDNLTSKDPYLHMATSNAIRSHHQEVALELLRRHHELVAEKNDDLWLGFLRTSVSSECEGLVQFILDKMPVAKKSGSLNLAVEHASRVGSLRIMELLLARSTETNLTSWHGATYWAGRRSNPGMLDLLFSRVPRDDLNALLHALAGAASSPDHIPMSQVLKIARQHYTIPFPDEAPDDFVETVDQILSRIAQIEAAIFTDDATDPPPNSEEEVASGNTVDTEEDYQFDANSESKILERPCRDKRSEPPSDAVLLKQACDDGDWKRSWLLIAAIEAKGAAGVTHWPCQLCEDATISNQPAILLYLYRRGYQHLKPDLAARVKSMTIYQVFMDSGWKIDQPAYWEDAPTLGHAIMDEAEDLARWLLEQGADPNQLHPLGFTPMSAVIWGGSPASIQLLLQYGADVRKGDLLHWLGDRSNDDSLALALADCLVALGFPLDAHWSEYDENGCLDTCFTLGTPLHTAIDKKRSNLARFLLLRGADPFSKNFAGLTAFEMARRSGIPEINEISFSSRTK